MRSGRPAVAALIRSRSAIIYGQHMVLDRLLSRELLQFLQLRGILAARSFTRLKSFRVS